MQSCSLFIHVLRANFEKPKTKYPKKFDEVWNKKKSSISNLRKIFSCQVRGSVIQKQNIY